LASSIINSDDGIISGTTGLKTTGGNDGSLKIQANGTDAISISSAGAVTLSGGLASALTVPSGGTGATSLTSNNLIVGNGTSAVQFVAPGSSGQVLKSNGTTWSSSALSGSDISTGTVGVSVGGTGATTLTANNVILGNGTSAVQFVAPGTSGNVLTSNGTTWTSAAAGGGGSPGLRATVFTGNGTFTIPTGVTQVKITVVGAGGGIQTLTSAQLFSGAGAGATAFKWLTGLTPGNTLSVTVGAGVSGGTGGTSSVASGTQSITTVSATGGNIGNNSVTAQPTGGTATNGDINIPGSMGFTFSTTSTGAGGASLFSGTTSGGRTTAQASEPGQLYGGGACPGYNACGTVAAVAGGSGIVIFEY
jgi:hypothetical protein